MTLVLHNIDVSRIGVAAFIGVACVLLAMAIREAYVAPTRYRKVRDALPWGLLALVMIFIVRLVSESEGVSSVSVSSTEVTFNYPWSSVVVKRDQVDEVNVRIARGRGTRRSGRTESLVVEVKADGTVHKMSVRTHYKERAEQLRHIAELLRPPK